MLASATAAFSQQQASAEKLYVENCLKCHGDRAQGGGAGTRTLLEPQQMSAEFDRKYFDAIKDGVPDTGMEPFGQTNSDADVWALVAYVRELQYKAHRQRTGAVKPGGDGVIESKHHSYKVERVITSGVRVPWSVTFLPDGKMLVADRPGSLRVHSTGKIGGTLSEPIAGTPEVRDAGQGGLMDVAVHPNYEKNGWVFLAYSHANGQNTFTRVVRGKIGNSGGKLAWTDQKVLFEARPGDYSGGGVHFGCRIVFDPKDPSILFFGIGERGRAELAQNLDKPNGKIYRIKDDGSIPPGNPFADRGNAYPAIWSYGHRNPQGLAFDLDGNLWDTEHGPRGGDELNLILPGRNYGWPVVSYGYNYNGSSRVTPWPKTPAAAADPVAPGAIVMPVWRWLPSIAACGLDVARGDAFPQWKGDLFAGGLAGQIVQRLRIKDRQVIEHEEIIQGMGRVRDVVCGPDGSLYVVLNDPDHIIRLAPTGK